MPSINSIDRHDYLVGALSAGTFATGPSLRLNRVEVRQYLQMQRAYARTGGLLSGNDAAHRLRRYCDQPLSTLARWIVTGTIVSFEWRSQILVPIFQFDPAGMALRPAVVKVLREFQDVLDDWKCAFWFAEPNAWLDDAAPVDAVSTQPHRVLSAARADRFVARG